MYTHTLSLSHIPRKMRFNEYSKAGLIAKSKHIIHVDVVLCVMLQCKSQANPKLRQSIRGKTLQ